MDTSILVGNFYATIEFFRTLQNWEYRVQYYPGKHRLLLLKCNPSEGDEDDKGWDLLLELERVPEETVQKLVQILDLEKAGFPYTQENWKSRIPLITMQHPGTLAADQVISEFVRLGLPYHADKCVKKADGHINLRFGRGTGIHEHWACMRKDESVDRLIDSIRAFAEKHGKLKVEEVA